VSERIVLSYRHGVRRFNYRVAAVIIAEGHVLVCREDDDDYVQLPGGRVELGETSADGIEREIAEELAMPAEIGPMIATSESFYRAGGEDYHELSFFYRAHLPGQGPDGNWPWLLRHDEGHELKFYWVSLKEDALEAISLLPPWLPGFLRQEPAAPVHVIHDERAGV
jgi:ADP-ribose pyrophosphatase